MQSAPAGPGSSTNCCRDISGSHETAQHITELARGCEDRQVAPALEGIEPGFRNMRCKMPGGLEGYATIMRPVSDERGRLDVLQYRHDVGGIIQREEAQHRFFRQTQALLDELLCEVTGPRLGDDCGHEERERLFEILFVEEYPELVVDLISEARGAASPHVVERCPDEHQLLNE